MRISFDSNAWEQIFDRSDRGCEPIRLAMAQARLSGFICASGLCIEAVRKDDRPGYFAQPYMGTRSDGVVVRDGRPSFHLSFGPDDDRHPGLPPQQAAKLQTALAAGVRLMHGLNWMGLPAPPEIRDPSLYVSETIEARREREERQLDVASLIDARGVGRAAFDAAGGWDGIDRGADNRQFRKACAEWADGELVGAHIAYRNDALCTNDRARGAGRSIFDSDNRAWLVSEFCVGFKTVGELAAELGA